jgi:hypothetical protein
MGNVAKVITKGKIKIKRFVFPNQTPGTIEKALKILKRKK